MALVYEVHPAGMLEVADGLGVSGGLNVVAGASDATGDADEPMVPHAATQPIRGIARHPAIREETAGVNSVALFCRRVQVSSSLTGPAISGY
jgi:hypothetical protein